MRWPFRRCGVFVATALEFRKDEEDPASRQKLVRHDDVILLLLFHPMVRARSERTVEAMLA
eukprot:scaffold422980_cov45-Attheya_sp.AAC.2